MMPKIGSQIVSKLGSPNSRIPLAIKDACNVAGYTYFSYDAGGKVEGKDRFFDEVGTGALWLFGIPAFKKLTDKLILKPAGIDPEIDIRVIKDSEYLKKAIENAPTKEICEKLKKAGENTAKTKNLNMLKFALSIGLTMVSYFGLTKIKQAMTKRNIEKEFFDKQKKQTFEAENNNLFPVSEIFNSIAKIESKKNPSFGSSAIIRTAEEFMLNPVKNMFLLDVGISTERLKSARTKGEFAEYAIKEGSFLFFIYGAEKLIRKGINKAGEKIFKIPANADIKFLTSDLAKGILKDKKLQKQITTFAQDFSNNTDINALYDFILKNQQHPVVEAAKASGIISTIKDASGNIKIDTRKFIDPKEIEKLTTELNKFLNLHKPSKETPSKYLNRIKNFKVASTIMNIAICCLAIGYIVPKMMYKYRAKQQNGNNEFHVKSEYEKELAAKYAKTL